MILDHERSITCASPASNNRSFLIIRNKYKCLILRSSEIKCKCKCLTTPKLPLCRMNRLAVLQFDWTVYRLCITHISHIDLSRPQEGSIYSFEKIVLKRIFTNVRIFPTRLCNELISSFRFIAGEIGLNLLLVFLDLYLLTFNGKWFVIRVLVIRQM